MCFQFRREIEGSRVGGALWGGPIRADLECAQFLHPDLSESLGFLWPGFDAPAHRAHPSGEVGGGGMQVAGLRILLG